LHSESKAINMPYGGDKPGVVLLDETDQRRLFSSDDPITPLDSIASPAIYYQQPTYARKSGVDKGGNTTMQAWRHEEGNMYPGDGSDSRWSFLRQTNPQIGIAVLLGTALGIWLSHISVSTAVSDLVNLPGKIFLRLLKCFVIPMVLCSLSTGVASIVLLGKVSAVGTRTAFFFLLFSGIASTLSLAVSMALRPLNPHTHLDPPPKVQGFMHVQCAPGRYMIAGNGSMDCTATTMSELTRFELIDLSHAIIASGPVTHVSIAQQFTQIIQSVFPRNIFKTFEDGVLLSVIMFSIAFGAAAMRASSQQSSPLLELLNQINKIFFFVISKLIDWSPIAVLSLIAGSLSSQDSLSVAMKHVGVLVLSNFISVIIFELAFYPVVLWMATRRNPYKYMRQMLPCVYFGFGSASSIASLPVTLRCVESTREVSKSLLRFVVTIGSSVHMNGTAMLFPNAIVFLATTASTDIELGWVQLSLIVLVSLLSSLGVAPIPNGGLIMIYSIWSTIFPNFDMPASYSFLVAIYWYLDRVNTACNVVGDTYVARIIAEHVDEAFETVHETAC
jgi:Na+/H+-dicarboxylate symporter